MIARLLSAIWPDHDAEIIKRALKAAESRNDMRTVGRCRMQLRQLRFDQLRGVR